MFNMSTPNEVHNVGCKTVAQLVYEGSLTYYLDDLEYGTQGSKDQQGSCDDMIGMITY